MTQQAVHGAAVAERATIRSTLSARVPAWLRLSHLLAVALFVACAMVHGVAHGSAAKAAEQPAQPTCSASERELDPAADCYRQDQASAPGCEADALGPDDTEDDAGTEAVPSISLTLYVVAVSARSDTQLALRSSPCTARALASCALPRGPPAHGR
jgi:hypothetical protein